MQNSFLKIHQNFTAALSYMMGPFTGLICYIGESLTGNNNKYVKFHALQSTIFFTVLMVLQFVLGLLPFTGFLVNILGFIYFVALFYLMWSAFSGKEFRIPIIGDACWEQVNK